MTNERAIELLNRLQDEQFDGIHGDERREALSMAVRALEGDGDMISREMAIDAVVSAMIDGADAELVEGVMELLPSAQPEVIRCKDCKHQIKEWRDDKRLKDKGYWVYGCKVISDICGCWAWFGQDDDFCSEAERRTDG